MLRKDVNFNRSRISVNTTNPIQDIKNYVEQRSGKYGISINKLLTDILDINKSNITI